MQKKNAIIIGASSEIGREVIKKLKEKFWNVYGTFNKHKKDLSDLLGPSNIFKIDLNQENSKERMQGILKKIWKKEQKIDAGIYIAGLWKPFFKFVDEDENKIKEMWNVNYFGAYWFFKFLTPYAIQTKKLKLCLNWLNSRH